MKKFLSAAAFFCISVVAFAYNPPYGGEEIYRITNPEMMCGAASAAGGPIFTVIPSSITYNPALTAYEQRIDLDLSGTAFINTNKIDEIDDIPLEDDSTFGSGFQVGLMVPTKWSVFTATSNFLFADFNGMKLRKSIVIHGGASKEVNERVGVGANLYTGFYLGTGSDFSVGVDLGALYKMDDFSIFKNPRLGLSLLNLGKAADYETIGLDVEDESSPYPSSFTFRSGFGAEVFEVSKWKGAFSIDLALAGFRNPIADLGFAASYNDRLKISMSWQANLKEMSANDPDGISLFSFGVSLKLGLNSRKLSEKNADWEKSELTPSLATQNLYSGIQAVSFGTRLDLGMKDTTAPEIKLWDEE